MDEPFGALDAQTRGNLQEELLRIWEKQPTTMLFVTHSIPEAVFLSTRVVVMASQPGRIFEEYVVDEPARRTDEFRTSSRFAQHARALSAILTRAAHASVDPTADP